MPQKPIAEVVRVDVAVIGPRNFPIAELKLPLDLVRDLPDLVYKAQLRDPTVTVEAVVRSIWRCGARSVWLATRQKRALQEPQPEVPDAHPSGN